MTANGDDEIPYDPRKYPMRLLGAQLAVASLLGIGALLTFCVLRIKWPQLFDARRARRSELLVCASIRTFYLWNFLKHQ